VSGFLPRAPAQALTQREWMAIEEALNARLAGPRDNEDEPEAPTTKDYEQAHRKVMQRIK
jgi:hypothetical protein